MSQMTLERKSSDAKYYRLTNEEWLRVVHDLKPAERDVLYYIRTLDPFGTLELELGVREMADTLGCNPGTVSRALKVLDQKGYIELDLVTVRVRIKNCNEVLSTDNTVAYRQHDRSVDNTHDRETTPVISRQHPRSPNSSPDAGFKNEQCTNNNSGEFVKQQNTVPTPRPVENLNEQEGIGTCDRGILGALIGAIEDGDIPINKTIRREVLWLIQEQGEEETVRRVHNAISAVREQTKENKVRNPGGLLMQGLRSGFTANEEKRKAREKRQDSNRSKPLPPNLEQVSTSVDAALFSGDRPFALARIQQLWADGWLDLVRELCQLRRDWGFVIGEDGPQWKEL
jgi:hypothetical protein